MAEKFHDFDIAEMLDSDEAVEAFLTEAMSTDDAKLIASALGVAVKAGRGIEQRVHPTMVPKDTAIAQVMGVTNAVTVDAGAIAPITLVGPGAGGAATASAVVSDIGDIARGVRTAPFGRPAARLATSRKAPMQRHEGGYYIRLNARDVPGALANIATRMAEVEISLESVIQRSDLSVPDAENAGVKTRTVVLITHSTMEATVREAIAHIADDGFIRLMTAVDSSGASQLS